MTEMLLNKVKEKNMLYKQCMKEPLNIFLKNHYNQIKNTLSCEVTIVKKNYYKNYLEKNRKDSRRQWWCIKEIIGESGGQQNKLSVKNVNGVVESDP